MKTSNNTVLITGGTAGIGLEIARILSERGDKVIITGRNQQRLENALGQLKNATGILSDVTDKNDTESLTETLTRDFPELDLIINNAGQAYLYDIANSEGAYEKAEDEMRTNFLSVLRLNEKLLPVLKKQKEAAIVNVSSIVAIVPGALVSYSASKAALHSYTQSLRIALSLKTDVKVFELMPPLVDTEFSASIGGHKGIKPVAVAEALLHGLDNNIYEIRVGRTEDIYKLYLSSPEQALRAMHPELNNA